MFGYKKRWLILSLLIIILLVSYVFLLEKSTKKPEKSITSIVFAHTDVEDAASFGKSNNYISELLKEFEKLHPGIIVKEQILPNHSNLKHQYFVINLEGKTDSIDVISLDPIWIKEFAKADWILNLDKFVEKKDYKDFLDILSSDVNIYNNNIYALPWIFGTGLIYYRQDLLQKYGFNPPKTLEEMAYQAKYILKKENRSDLDGFLWQGFESEGQICIIFEYIYGHGGTMFKDGKLIIDNLQNKQAFAFIKDLFLLNISPNIVKTEGKAELRKVFLQGNAVFLRDWSFVKRQLSGEQSPLYGKVGVINALPFKGYKSSPVIGGYMLGINKYSKHPKESYELIKFLTNYKSQKYIAGNTDFKPSRKSVYKDKELLEKDSFLNTYYQEIIPTIKLRPLTPYYFIFSNILQTEFTGMLIGLKPVDTGLTQIKKQIELLMNISKTQKENFNNAKD